MIIKKSLRFVVPAALVISALAFSACAKKESNATATAKDAAATVSDKAKEVYHDSKDAIVGAWGDVKAYTYEKRSDFTAHAKATSSKVDSQLSEVRANYSEAKASASRKAAMAELKDSEADYKEKVAALGSASADTWDSAKQNVVLAWDKVQAAYYKARAD